MATATVLVTLAFTVRSISVLQNNSQYQPQLAGNVVDTGDQPSQPENSNIRSAEPTPSSCTPTQNCGRSSCAAAKGGSCGCGG
ncbi:MAG: hypothetical protein V3U72_03530 [Candidatus Aenigmarchaeota archaeon]